jgi:hypothetical protein
MATLLLCAGLVLLCHRLRLGDHGRLALMWYRWLLVGGGCSCVWGVVPIKLLG